MTQKRREEKLVSAKEIARQEDYINLLKPLLQTRYGENPKAYVHTFGCQGNLADSERMKGMLNQMGYVFVDAVEEADFILFNTCAIRETAEDRVFGNVGALKVQKKAKPNTIIALCGCMMQQTQVAGKIYQSYPFVNLVFGTHVIHRLPELLWETINSEKRVFEIPDMDGIIAEGIPVVRDDVAHAWVPIMYGCNNFCSYCIVPYVRGRERSRLPKEILNEVKEVVAAGYGEITLLGQNVNSYGNDFKAPYAFAKLLREINAIEGNFRIKFMTSHPKDCTKELIDTMAECEKVARHLHLPVQSGNNRVLDKMNRKYTREHYLSLAQYAKEKMPDITLSSDIIVGFPGETYEEFLDTVSLIETVRFTSLFTFIFSSRQGTPAAKYDDPVSRKEKGQWFSKLLEEQDKITSEEIRRHVGSTMRVLIDKNSPKDDIYTGKTDGGTVVYVSSPENITGQLVKVKMNSVKAKALEGTLMN